MKVKINGVNTFLVQSTFAFIMVILNVFIFCPFAGINKNTWCAKLGILCSTFLPCSLPEMVHISFWPMRMMLICWGEAYIR